MTYNSFCAGFCSLSHYIGRYHFWVTLRCVSNDPSKKISGSMHSFWVNSNYVNINSRFWHNMSFAAWRHSGRCRRLRGCQWAQWHAWTWYHHPWCPHACCKHKFRSCKHKFGISTYWIWNLLDDGILGAVGGSVDSVNSLACLHAIPITPNGPTHAVNINSDLVNITQLPVAGVLNDMDWLDCNSQVHEEVAEAEESV